MAGHSGPPDFENTQIAFQSKTDSQIKKAYFLFQMLNIPFLNQAGTLLAQVALSLGMPIHGLIQATVFDQFCGGVSLEDSKSRVEALARHGVGTSLDYSVEAVDGDQGYADTVEETLNMVQFAAENPSVEFVVVKPTGIGSMSLMEKVSKERPLTQEEELDLQAIRSRLDLIAKAVSDAGQRLFIDAEDSWYQDCVDMLARELMQKYNREKVCIYSTIQFYRKGRLEFLKRELERSHEGNYRLGFKLVRGAYLEKERERAALLSYPDPIQDTKEDTDRDYNLGVELCLENIDKMAFCAATHNERSAALLCQKMSACDIEAGNTNVFFSQLFGMGDQISYNLARAGYNVCKYLPYGPVVEMIPYLIRRAQENSSIAGQASRDLRLLKNEIRRRKI